MEADGRRAWLGRHRDLERRGHEPWIRRIGLLVFLAIAVAGLVNVFGQRAETSSARNATASLELDAPARARGGLIFQARFDVHAFQEVREPALVLDPGWYDGLTENTTAPEPAEERTDDGRAVLQYDTIPAGRKLTVWLQYQVNPTHFGRTDQDVELWDGTTRLTHLNHSLTVFP